MRTTLSKVHATLVCDMGTDIKEVKITQGQTMYYEENEKSAELWDRTLGNFSV